MYYKLHHKYKNPKARIWIKNPGLSDQFSSCVLFLCLHGMLCGQLVDNSNDVPGIVCIHGAEHGLHLSDCHQLVHRNHMHHHQLLTGAFPAQQQGRHIVHLLATLSKLLAYCVFRSTQPFNLTGMGNE